MILYYWIVGCRHTLIIVPSLCIEIVLSLFITMAAEEMDAERVRAYLQVACAGLGFEIGEVWWTSSEKGHSTVASIGKRLPSSSAFQLPFCERNRIRAVRCIGNLAHPFAVVVVIHDILYQITY